jgi:hypothetical protein
VTRSYADSDLIFRSIESFRDVQALTASMRYEQKFAVHGWLYGISVAFLSFNVFKDRFMLIQAIYNALAYFTDIDHLRNLS